MDCDSYDYCGTLYKTCASLNETISPLQITIGDEYVYSLPVSTWSQDGYDGDDNGCSLLVSSNTDSNAASSITLGVTFLEQFTLSFD